LSVGSVPADLATLYVGVLLLVGAAMGSFLNVVIYRAPLGKSLLYPPSSCPRCGVRIRARDNIPILGWLLLGGRCRACRRPISLRYPAVELVAALVWAAEGWRLAGLDRGFWPDVLTGLAELAFLSALIVTFLVDWDHLIILDEISLGGLAGSLATAALVPALHQADSPAAFESSHPLMTAWLSGAPAWGRALAASLAGALTGLTLSLSIYFLGNIAFRRQIEAARREDPEVDSALGLGDVKLMAFFGAFLGWRAVPFIFLAASLFGAFAGSAMKMLSGQTGGQKGWAGLANRWRTGGSVIPFGPFLAAGAIIAFFWDWRIF
jgi:leader peptidase (prepilin peptidase)/N-methyltransferase